MGYILGHAGDTRGMNMAGFVWVSVLIMVHVGSLLIVRRVARRTPGLVHTALYLFVTLLLMAYVGLIVWEMGAAYVW